MQKFQTLTAIDGTKTENLSREVKYSEGINTVASHTAHLNIYTHAGAVLTAGLLGPHPPDMHRALFNHMHTWLAQPLITMESL